MFTNAFGPEVQCNPRKVCQSIEETAVTRTWQTAERYVTGSTEVNQKTFRFGTPRWVLCASKPVLPVLFDLCGNSGVGVR